MTRYAPEADRLSGFIIFYFYMKKERMVSRPLFIRIFKSLN